MTLLDYYHSRFGQAVKRQGNGYNGPCPLCGGEPGKSDRFMVWPERTESLGELCTKHYIPGIWHCRQCDEGGDTIAYLTKCEGMSFKDALAELGIEGTPTYRRKSAPVEPVKTSWQPRESALPNEAWLKQAEKLVAKAETTIQDTPQALKWLAARGLDEEAVRKYRIGYLKAESDKYQGSFRPRSSFGLEPKVDKEGNKREKLFIPRGILIPTFGHTGEILNLRIRRHKADLKDRAPKYLELEGSSRAPMFLASSQPRQLAVYFVTEAELDAILIHHMSNGVAGAVAVRTNRGKPDAFCHQHLAEAVRVCVALDYDQAGAEGCDFWEETYSTSMRWPTPEGKDPGDAFSLGVDIRQWIGASFPSCVPQLHRSSITQNNQEIQEIIADGQEDTTPIGKSILGEGGKPGNEKIFPSEKRARLHERALAGEAGSDAPEWASEEDFTQDELALLKQALPQGMSLDCLYLDVAVIWLLWRNMPVALLVNADRETRVSDFRWSDDPEWVCQNRERYELFHKYQESSQLFWKWVRDFPTGKITWQNVLNLWDILYEEQKNGFNSEK